MGWIFPLKYSNIVAFITAPGPAIPPRITRHEFREFLESFRSFPQHEQELQPWQARFISSRPEWIHHVQKAASATSHYIDSLSGERDDILGEGVVNEALSDLKTLLGGFELFGLAVRREWNHEFDAFITEAAYSSRGYAIYLVPDDLRATFDVLDPFPAIALIAEEPDKWPGVLFWSRSGEAAFCSLDEARVLHAEMLEIFRSPSQPLGEKVDRVIKAHRSLSTSKKVLHLSDLHFGTQSALENEAYLSAHLASLVPGMSRVVITGDLLQNPERHDFLAFRNFLASLMRTGADPVVIPGNHDQKWMGLFGTSLKQLVNLEWSTPSPTAPRLNTGRNTARPWRVSYLTIGTSSLTQCGDFLTVNPLFRCCELGPNP